MQLFVILNLLILKKLGRAIPCLCITAAVLPLFQSHAVCDRVLFILLISILDNYFVCPPAFLIGQQYPRLLLFSLEISFVLVSAAADSGWQMWGMDFQSLDFLYLSSTVLLIFLTEPAALLLSILNSFSLSTNPTKLCPRKSNSSWLLCSGPITELLLRELAEVMRNCWWLNSGFSVSISSCQCLIIYFKSSNALITFFAIINLKDESYYTFSEQNLSRILIVG